ncbi:PLASMODESMATA CALLOSE-BINDING PROTEIN 5-like isoform X1 [Cucurbita pepo subsp. pepo]|uniref:PLASMODESMATA CALLOSE-BINDING PROTEIN 5-like isoform X1 n=1 Tax=Cucurbita pepo subsp. pepo TaxID=3664 RepID=UPI000C9D4246|nr:PLASMODESMATA CALLOSE-BINDING PROTEIN 5-like isoform X1 [Cucurbita pepo subsp. pepo]
MANNFALFLLILLILGSSAAESRQPSTRDQSGATELWCVAKNNADDASLQSALDWACGAGGADCSPIQPGGACYDASNVQNMASFAFNDYFRKHGMTDDSCFFQNAAAITSLNPSYGNCRIPASSLRNGNFSSQTPSVGLGPSEDISGSGRKSGRSWVWPMIFVVPAGQDRRMGKKNKSSFPVSSRVTK